MRPLVLVLACLLAACDASAPSGTLGLPSPRVSPGSTATPPPTAAPSASPSPSRSPSASPAASPSPDPSPTATTAPSASPPPSASAAPSATPDGMRPVVVDVIATQSALTVVFSEPMRTTLACGTTFGTVGRPATGAIDDRSHYRSSDPVFDEALQSASLVTINGDCAAVTFLLSAAAASGTYPLAVSSVQDRGGNVIAAGTSARVTIADEGRPRALRADSSGDAVTISFSEPMLRIGEGSGVVMAGNYRLDGNTPPIMAITCADAGCRTVRLALRTGTLVAGRTYQLRIANVVDRAGQNITPDPTTLTFVAG